MISRNMQAFLDMISFSELGSMAHRKDKGSSIIVGSRPGRLAKIKDFSDHPRVAMQLSGTLWSTAAGSFQILQGTFDYYRDLLKLRDFSYQSQCAIAIQLIKEQGAYELVEVGRIAEAIAKVSNIWASLPGAGYGQHENKMKNLLTYYSTQRSASC